MTKELMSLDDFSKKYKIYEGEWELYFSDDNYIPTNKFIKLGKVIFDDIGKENFEDDFENIYNSFTIHINDQKQIMDSLEECWEKKCNLKEEEKIKFIDALFQEISKSLIRVGIIKPDIDERVFNEMQKANILTIVYDTNALVNGTINYLLYELENHKILNIIPKFSQLEIQEKASTIKRVKSEISQCKRIAERAFNTNTLRILHQIKNKYPLEYIGDSNSLNISKRDLQDKRNVLYDRLIIETIKNIYGSRNSNSKVIFVTGDYDMARFARIDNIDVLYSTFKKLNIRGDSCYSARFSIVNSKFHCCSIYDLLWDFTNLFSRVKFENKNEKKSFVFNYYFPTKKLENWEKDHLEFDFIDQVRDFRERIDKFADRKNKSIKMLGLDNVLNFIELLGQNKETSIMTCVEKLKLSEKTIRDYLYVFEGIGLIRFENKTIIATDLVNIFIKEWDSGNISNLIVIFRNYEPYDKFLNMMKDIKYISKYNTNIEETKKKLDKYGIGDYKAMRVFPNLGIYLGVLYPFQDRIYWANELPNNEMFEKAFLSAYNKHKISEGYASMVDIINEVCININISIRIFIQLFNYYYQKNKIFLRTGSSVMTDSKNIIELLESRSYKQRFSKYVLEDGLMISGNAIKSIRLGKENE